METIVHETETIYNQAYFVNSILQILSIVIFVGGFYLVVRLLISMIKYYERLNREAKKNQQK